MYEFWYDYAKPKYGENVKACYMDTDNFIVHAKTEDIYKNDAEDVERRFDTSNVQLDRPFPKKKKVLGLMKNKLDGQMRKEFLWLKAKPYSYLKDNKNEDKKTESTKKCVIKIKFKFQNYKNCLESVQFENEINHFKKNKTDVDSLKKDQKELIKNNKIILKHRKDIKVKDTILLKKKLLRN